MTCLITNIGEQRYTRFSKWGSLHRSIALLVHVARSYTADGRDLPKNRAVTQDELDQAKRVILESVQKEAYPTEFAALSKKQDLPRASSIAALDPYMEDGLMRVGGRLKHARLDSQEKNPIILPRRNHVSTLLVRHFHERVHHQGRHYTEGAIRAGGFWIVGGKRLVSSILQKCVTCKRLRGKMEQQKMADLPPERLSTAPPFTFVGLDVFGPWSVFARRTRGGHAESKRWAVLFTCMSTRAVHIEIIESMDSSSCINALRRFIAIRGPPRELRSDCGTNFIGACNELKIDKNNQRETDVRRFLDDRGCTWRFNPPHSSHMGGAWERLIGAARRILDAILLQSKICLTHEVLATFLAEVAAIINARPLVPVSTDPESPFILTPATLLTQKVGVQPQNTGVFTDKDLFRGQWRQVQRLADTFWTRWRREYLPTLQSRPKWRESHQNLRAGDLVLMKDKQVTRNSWPLAMVTSSTPGTDGRVRTVELKVVTGGASKTFMRPVSEVVLLLPERP